jgi:hypothetical protein
MKPKQPAVTKQSQREKVDAYMQGLVQPLADVAEALRKIILSTDPEIGEEIKWNAPAFFYSGDMKPPDPKKYDRYLAVFNFHKRDCIRLVFLSAARVGDRSGLLEGDYEDGRRLALFHNMQEVIAKKAPLQSVIREWLRTLDRN